MPTYDPCGRDVQKMAEKVIHKFHQHLAVEKVTIDYLFAYADTDARTGEKKGPALKHHGRAALGLAKLNSAKDRARGLGDCLVMLDGDWWLTVDDEEREAVLDHELTHFVIVEEGARDKQGRPKLALRLHDVEVGWFNVIAERHGLHSQERKQAAAMVEQYGQTYWPEILGSDKGGRMGKLEVMR